jgi:AraC-like DNA-binding protein
MLFDEITPFARFPRELAVFENSSFGEVFPVDARIFYVNEGVGKIFVDGGTVIMPRGSALFINSGVIYRIVPSFVKYLAINFDWTQNFCEYNMPIPPIPLNKAENRPSQLENVSFEDTLELNGYSYCENAFFAEKPLKRMIDRYEKKEPHYRTANNAELVLLLTEFVRRLNTNKNNSFNSAAVADYIQAHYNEEITNRKIAEIFHFHPNYISSEFKRIFGKPLHRYLLELRITKAIALLETGRYSVESVSEEVGFKDANYFIRYFKKITGKTPKNIFS